MNPYLWKIKSFRGQKGFYGRCRHDECNRSIILYRSIRRKVLLLFKVQPQEIIQKTVKKERPRREDAFFFMLLKPEFFHLFFYRDVSLIKKKAFVMPEIFITAIYADE